MRRKKRPLWLLVLSILSLGGFIYLIFFTDPSDKISLSEFFGQTPISSPLNLSTLILFFTVLFIFIFSFITYLLRSIRRGILSGIFVVSYLILRLNHLDQLFFLLVLLALFVTLELVFTRQK